MPNIAYQRSADPDSGGKIASPTLPLSLAIVTSIFLSMLLGSAPALLFLIIDLLFSIVIFLTLSSKWRIIALFHPFLILFFSLFYTQSFLELGDGPAYELTVSSFLDTKSFSINYDSWVFRDNLLNIFKTAGFGVVPTYLIPDFISGYAIPIDYYYCQSAIHVFLVAVAASLSKSWKSVSQDNLDIIILYSVIGPSFFELGLAPTRHYVTFFSILLFFVSFMALVKLVTLPRIFGILLSIFLVLISKAVLMAPLLLFVVAHFTLSRTEGKMSTALLGLASVVVGAIILGPYLLSKFRDYAGGVAIGETGSMGYLVIIPVVGQILKLLFALLSPFPWYKMGYFVDFGYGGNWPLFVVHMTSSLVGLHLFISIAMKWTEIYRSPDIELRNTVIFGLIMSASIFGGATGFHAYILIYFPYLMVIVKNKNYQASPFLAVLVAVTLNILMAITGFGSTDA